MSHKIRQIIQVQIVSGVQPQFSRPGCQGGLTVGGKDTVALRSPEQPGIAFGVQLNPVHAEVFGPPDLIGIRVEKQAGPNALLGQPFQNIAQPAAVAVQIPALVRGQDIRAVRHQSALGRPYRSHQIQ